MIDIPLDVRSRKDEERGVFVVDRSVEDQQAQAAPGWWLEVDDLIIARLIAGREKELELRRWA